MPVRYWIAGAVAFSVIIGWNVFLIHRDAELFRANTTQSAEVRK